MAALGLYTYDNITPSVHHFFLPQHTSFEITKEKNNIDFLVTEECDYEEDDDQIETLDFLPHFRINHQVNSIHDIVSRCYLAERLVFYANQRIYILQCKLKLDC